MHIRQTALYKVAAIGETMQGMVAGRVAMGEALEWWLAEWPPGRARDRDVYAYANNMYMQCMCILVMCFALHIRPQHRLAGIASCVT